MRRFGAQYRSPSYTHARIRRPTRPTTTSATRTTSAPPGGRCGSRRANAWHARARRRVRREVGLGAGQLVRVERRRGRRVAAPARLGRPALVAGDRRRAPRHPRGASAIFDESLVREDGDRRARAPRTLLERLCDNRVARERRARSPTPRCSTAAAGSSATSPSPGSARSCFSIVTGTAFGNHDREWIRKHLPEDGTRPGPRRHLGLVVLRDLGPAGARRARAADPGRPLERGLPVHVACARSRSATSRCGRCGSPTSASSAGSSTARPSTGSGSGGRCGRPGEPHGIVAGGYRAIDSMRLEKGYRVWGADITPDETPYEGGRRLLRQARQGGRLHRPRGAGRGEGARAADAALLPDARRPALGRARQRAGPRSTARSSAG